MNDAEEAYSASKNVSRTGPSGTIVHWPEAVQHLIHTDATENSIFEAIDDFREVLKSSTENETAYATIFNLASYRCVNLHEEEDKITMYVN